MSKIFNFHASFDDRKKKRKKALDNEIEGGQCDEFIRAMNLNLEKDDFALAGIIVDRRSEEDPFEVSSANGFVNIFPEYDSASVDDINDWNLFLKDGEINVETKKVVDAIIKAMIDNGIDLEDGYGEDIELTFKANDSVDDEGGWIYLFPELDESDLHWAKEYDLEFKGINNHNKEKNFVMEGFKGDILEFAEDMGYMLHEDYLYEPGTFDGDVNKAEDAAAEYEVGKYDKEWGVFAKRSRAWVAFGTKGEMTERAKRLNELEKKQQGSITEDALAKAEDNNTIYVGIAADFTDPDNIPDADYREEIKRALRISRLLTEIDENGIVYAEGTYDQWVKYFELNSWMKGLIPEYENGKQFMDEMIETGAITAEGHFAEDEAYVPDYPNGVTVGDHIAVIEKPFTNSELKKLTHHGVKYHGYQDFGDGVPVEVIEGYEDDMDALLESMGRPATGKNDIFYSEDFEFGKIVPKDEVDLKKKLIKNAADKLMAAHDAVGDIMRELAYNRDTKEFLNNLMSDLLGAVAEIKSVD